MPVGSGPPAAVGAKLFSGLAHGTPCPGSRLVPGWSKHDLRGSACCVCMCEPDRAEPAYAPRLGWRPSDGGRRRGRSTPCLRSTRRRCRANPKVLQPTSYLEYCTRLLRGRLQQPPPRHQGTLLYACARHVLTRHAWRRKRSLPRSLWMESSAAST